MENRIKSVDKMKKIMKKYYLSAKYAKYFGKKIAWITSGGPVEPLIAMGIIPVYPENHGAIIGASKTGAKLSEYAEGLGYSSDVCSYAKVDITSSIIHQSPIGGLPKPNMLICCNNICGTVQKWYEIQARKFNVPLFIYDTPFCHVDLDEAAKKYLKTQTKDYITFLEQVTKKRLDYDKMQEVGKLSVKAMKVWQAVLDCAIEKPSPLTAFDAFIHLALIVTLRGKKVVVDYYETLLKELKERIKNKVPAIENEKYRLLWDNLPIWYRMRWLSNAFAKHNGVLVADTYTQSWCSVVDYIDEDKFLETMGEAYARVYLNIGTDKMAESVIKLIDKYYIDGVVLHSNRSCKPYSFGQYDIARIIQEKRSVPTLFIESDMTDDRKFSEAQVENRINSFMEVIAQIRG
jgi:benzoyl-CoA reductase/2-hydroxyglutaryl-CoA dehydratase subunit BcrC/BadD/HgdB